MNRGGRRRNSRVPGIQACSRTALERQQSCRLSWHRRFRPAGLTTTWTGLPRHPGQPIPSAGMRLSPLAGPAATTVERLSTRRRHHASRLDGLLPSLYTWRRHRRCRSPAACRPAAAACNCMSRTRSNEQHAMALQCASRPCGRSRPRPRFTSSRSVLVLTEAFSSSFPRDAHELSCTCRCT